MLSPHDDPTLRSVQCETRPHTPKPSVGDFGRLRHDTATLKGWWSNRASRILLVFLLSTLGSAIGTYVAGFRIFDRLFS